MGAFVNFGADWLGPGRVLFGNRSAVVVGEINGTIWARTREMHELLEIFEPNAELTEDIWGYLWGKLGLRREVMATTLAERVVARGFNGYDPQAFAPGAH